MSKTINILGDTPRQQWLNAIMIFEECIAGNARDVLNQMDGICDRNPKVNCDECEECGRCRSLEIVVEQTKVYSDEMRRLVKGVFDE